MNRGARWPIQLVEVEVHTHFSIVYFAIPCLSVDCTSLPVDKKELRVMYKLCAAAVVIKGERLLQITMPALHHTRGTSSIASGYPPAVLAVTLAKTTVETLTLAALVGIAHDIVVWAPQLQPSSNIRQAMMLPPRIPLAVTPATAVTYLRPKPPSVTGNWPGMSG